jgi:hypothetical protein
MASEPNSRLCAGFSRDKRGHSSPLRPWLRAEIVRRRRWLHDFGCREPPVLGNEAPTPRDLKTVKSDPYSSSARFLAIRSALPAPSGPHPERGLTKNIRARSGACGGRLGSPSGHTSSVGIEFSPHRGRSSLPASRSWCPSTGGAPHDRSGMCKSQCFAPVPGHDRPTPVTARRAGPKRSALMWMWRDCARNHIRGLRLHIRAQRPGLAVTRREVVPDPAACSRAD